jgi:para-aminobenzoate synthetase / 4-amino-4-deoxychorismate lyase
MTRAILDFPDAAGEPQRLVFARPTRIISAMTLDEVRPALREAASAAAGTWAAGFIAYEAAPAFDPALLTRTHVAPVPLLWFGVFEPPVAVSPPPPAAAPPLDWRTTTPRVAYDDAIATIRAAIAAGDVYQVNHTLRFSAAYAHDPGTLYDRLVAMRHGLYHALIETDDWAVVSASPELFLDIAGRTITTRPMKGTVRRGRWLDEDRVHADRLAASDKDRAENVMIVDLLRNDLGRIAEPGSVRVPHLFDVETYPTVHQLTSTVTAQLRDDVGLDDIFAATFPCGSVTGAPKVTAMRAIAALEDTPRGIYCGAVGVLRPDGSATFNVAIRTILLDRVSGTASYGTGGGITWDSRADAEYAELVAKAGLLTETIPPFRLIETMRLDHGVVARFALHMSRLAGSARYWGFGADTARNACDALRQLANAEPDGRWRVRLTADRDGGIDITRTSLDGPAGALDDDTEPQTVMLTDEPVSRNDRLLFHKTTARDQYDTRRAAWPDAFDVLLFNEEAELTEFTTGNLVVDCGGTLRTPAHDCGLLAGTMREQLIRDGVIIEDVLPLDELRGARRVWLINSVRGWVRVTVDGGKGRIR